MGVETTQQCTDNDITIVLPLILYGSLIVLNLPPFHDYFVFQWLSFVLFFKMEGRKHERKRGKRVTEKIAINTKENQTLKQTSSKGQLANEVGKFTNM